MLDETHSPQANPFVGRADELREIARLLADPACRLLTLVGPGGIGKTRLALEAGHLLANAPESGARFADGVHVVALAPPSSGEFILSAIADAVGLQVYQKSSLKQPLLAFLAERALLLILDNFEHLLDSAGVVSELLEAGPRVKILVTSRERLNLLEEWVLAIRGLPYPAEDEGAAVDTYEAVQLFVQRAGRVQVGFELTPANRQAIARICALVGGMPLGIELAAAWVRVLSCEAIAEEIARGLDILETPARNINARHRSMRAVLDHSWNLLSQPERATFMKLAVFRGGFTREAAQEVAGASLRMLSVLADKSLLAYAGDGRYRIHELLRQYGLEHLEANPQESAELRARHARYYTAYVVRHTRDLRTLRQPAVLWTIEPELENIYAAWFWITDARMSAEMAQLMIPLAEYHDVQYRGHDACDLIMRAVQVWRAAQSPEDQRILGNLLVLLAGFHDYYDPAEAIALLKEGLALLRIHGQPEDIIIGLLALIPAYISLHGWTEGARPEGWDWTETVAVVQEALRLSRESGLLYLERRALTRASWVAFFQRDYEQALRLGEESMRLAEELDDLEAVAITSGPFLGRLAEVMGDYEKARALRHKSNALLRQLGRVVEVSWNYAGLGYLAYLEKDYPQAKAHYCQMLRLCLQIQDRGFRASQIMQHVGNIGLLLAAEKQPARALELAAFALQNPHSTREAQVWAGQLRDQVLADQPAESWPAAQERARLLDADTLAQRIIAAWSVENPPDAGREGATPPLDALNEREIEILRLVAEGLSNREIADRLVFAIGTVKWYINQIYSKLHVKSRTQAVARARERHLLP